ncbi:MAG: regulatory protein RecX [Clostridia bacterium]|jgi:SOS response regulatory protein OraA/RecX|nr:regulatory protein RecX [Clostridia bacterium]
MTESAYGFAVKKLSRRAYSVKELEDKLRQAGFNAAEAGETLERLLASGYLNDRAYAEKMYDYFTSRKPCGPRVLAHQLEFRGIPDALIRELLQNYSAEKEWELVQLTAAKLLRTRKDVSPDAFIRHLQRKGFTLQSVRKCLHYHGIKYVDKS